MFPLLCIAAAPVSERVEMEGRWKDRCENYIFCFAAYFLAFSCSIRLWSSLGLLEAVRWRFLSPLNDCICIYFTSHTGCFFTPQAVCLRQRLSWTSEYVVKHLLVCVYWLLHVIIEEQFFFMAKDCTQWQEVAMHFLKSNSIVLCIGGEPDGLTQLILAELVFKLQTLHVLWDWVATSRGEGPCLPRLSISACSLNVAFHVHLTKLSFWAVHGRWCVWLWL